MNSGRMTFRFDAEKDKNKHKPKIEDRWPSTGLGTADEYALELRPEVESPLHTWVHDPNSDLRSTREAPPEASYEYYSGVIDPREQDWDTRNQRDVRNERDTRNTRDTRNERDTWNQRDSRNERDEWRVSAVQNKYIGDNSPSDPGDQTDGYEGYEGYDNYGGSYHTRRPSYWWKFTLSIAGAIGTGVLLGYAALALFYGGDAADGTNASLATNTTTAGKQIDSESDPAGVGTSGLPLTGSEVAGKNSIAVQVAAQSYYLLQYGVFSTPAGAVQAQQELLDAGLAAGLDPTDGNRVYAGMSPDREQAKLLSGALKNEGIELYVREVVLPSAEKLVFSGDAEAVNRYFSISWQLLSELSSQSAALLSTSQTGTAANVSSVSDLHLQWSEAVKLLEAGLSPEQRSICASIEKSTSQAISALSEYNKNKAQALLWEVQESMLSFLTNQKKLLSAMM